jgi:hypothetical protein
MAAPSKRSDVADFGPERSPQAQPNQTRLADGGLSAADKKATAISWRRNSDFEAT